MELLPGSLRHHNSKRYPSISLNFSLRLLRQEMGEPKARQSHSRVPTPLRGHESPLYKHASLHKLWTLPISEGDYRLDCRSRCSLPSSKPCCKSMETPGKTTLEKEGGPISAPLPGLPEEKVLAASRQDPMCYGTLGGTSLVRQGDLLRLLPARGMHPAPGLHPAPERDPTRPSLIPDYMIPTWSPMTMSVLKTGVNQCFLVTGILVAIFVLTKTTAASTMTYRGITGSVNGDHPKGSRD